MLALIYWQRAASSFFGCKIKNAFSQEVSGVDEPPESFQALCPIPQQSPLGRISQNVFSLNSHCLSG